MRRLRVLVAQHAAGEFYEDIFEGGVSKLHVPEFEPFLLRQVEQFGHALLYFGGVEDHARADDVDITDGSEA